MRSQLPWLCQGDIFRDLPVVDLILQSRSVVRPRVSPGPAILLTHDCAMDKRKRDGSPKVERFQFSPLRTLGILPRDRAGTLRSKAQSLPPFDVAFLGETGELGETFFSLTDSFWLPAEYFEPEFREFSDHAEADETGEFICASINDTRMGRVDASQLDLIRGKMIAYWTRQQQDEGK